MIQNSIILNEIIPYDTISYYVIQYRFKSNDTKLHRGICLMYHMTNTVSNYTMSCCIT